MADELESPETIRSRIRAEARQRRQRQFLLRRAAARAFPTVAARDDSRSSSSRSTSPDLLASPPPPDVVSGTAVYKSVEKDGSLSNVLDGNVVTAQVGGGSSTYYGLHNRNDEGNTQIKGASVDTANENRHQSNYEPAIGCSKPKSKIKRKYCDSSSSSSEDEEEIAKRFARKAQQRQTTTVSASANKSKYFTMESDSDSSSTDFLAKRRAIRKKSSSGMQNREDEKSSSLTDEIADEATQPVSNVTSRGSDENQEQMDDSLVKCKLDIGTQQQDDEGACQTKSTAKKCNNNIKQSALDSKNDSAIIDIHRHKLPLDTDKKSRDETVTIDLTDSPVKAETSKETVLKTSTIKTFKSSPTEFVKPSIDAKKSQLKQSTLLGSFISPSKTSSKFKTLNDTTKQQSAMKSSMKPTQFVESTKPSAAASPPHNSDPIIARHTSTPSNVQWSVHKQCLIVRNIKNNNKDTAPRTKVAGFDLDQTLVQWRCSGWPSRPEHYELWSHDVIDKMQKLHDEGYKLVIFSNQGGIRGAFQGKNAAKVKSLIDWIAGLVDRPLFAVCSTKKDGGYHKGNPGMWTIMEDVCNGGVQAKPELSFFVGDADGTGDNARDEMQQQYQVEGVDKLFAENVGKLRNVIMAFFTPEKYFGRSNADRRKVLATVGSPIALTKEAMSTRAALLGGYLSFPILLVLVGVQGSGKSTLCTYLTEGNSSWRAYSQDTISNGKPGKREAVEAAAIASLRDGKNVVVDRMHLNSEQRSHFLKVGRQCNVKVHALVMMANKEEVQERVTTRINHPGGVEGVQGARIAVASLDHLTIPSYDEGFDLISYANDADGLVAASYRRVSGGIYTPHLKLYNCDNALLPMISFGTMGISKKETQSAVTRAIRLGIESVDTAPTYKNEGEIGIALTGNSAKVIIKVPKRVITASQARGEVQQSLGLLGRTCADLVLLHWPSDMIEAGSLKSVWGELEAMKAEGICIAIGVCNFSVGALVQLLNICDVKPALNQVERHPLLPQYDLLEYCQSQGIVFQAHTPLGQANKLLLENNTILAVSKDSGLTAAQVLLLWNTQQGVPVVAKFNSEEHAREITPILQSKIRLSPQQMQAIDKIGLATAVGTRFVTAPFMYKPGACYSWGDAPPTKH